MENAVDALKIAFAVLVLVIALAVSISSFNLAKNTSDIILYTKDETNYYQYQSDDDINKVQKQKIVGLETIIPNLYRYYKENYTIVFMEGQLNVETGDISGLKKMKLYKTQIEPSNWSESYKNFMKKKYSSIYKGLSIYNENLDSDIVFSFDLDEETLRNEPWTGSFTEIKKNLDSFLNGGSYTDPSTRVDKYSYGETSLLGNKNGFMGAYKKAKFVELLSIYTYSGDTEENANERVYSDVTNNKTKRVITYIHITNL